jgi:hypothetical protein
MGIKSPMVEGDVFEQAAMEVMKESDFKPEHFDEHRIMHGVLNKAFEQYGIEIDMKNFVFQKPEKPMVPAWMR